MRDVKIVFEVNDGNVTLDIKTEKPEDFVAGIGYMIKQTSEISGLGIQELIEAVQYAALL